MANESIFLQAREAVRENNKVELAVLVDQNSFPNSQLCELMLGAASRNHVGIMAYLVENGAPVEDRTEYQSQKDGLTPLHLATWEGHREAVEFLLDHGATVDPTQSGQTPLHWAIQQGHTEIAKILVERGADVVRQGLGLDNNATLLHSTVFHNRPTIAQVLLKAGADPSLRNAFGDTSRDQALKMKRTEVLEIIDDFSDEGRGKQ